MIIVALDLSGTVGWAAGDSTDSPAFGSHELPKVGKGIGALLGSYDLWLLRMIDEHRPELVIMEKPVAQIEGRTNFVTKYKLACLCGQTEHRCHAEEVPCEWVNVSTIKKYWTGNGRAKKPEMIFCAEQRGFAVKTDHEADALALWCYAVDLHAPEHHRWDRLGAMA